MRDDLTSDNSWLLEHILELAKTSISKKKIADILRTVVKDNAPILDGIYATLLDGAIEQLDFYGMAEMLFKIKHDHPQEKPIDEPTLDFDTEYQVNYESIFTNIPDNFPGSPITKRKLCDFLQVSERTVYNYQEIASAYCDDYLADFPVVDNEYVTSVPLSEYQALVLMNIHQFMSYFKNSRLLKDRLENDHRIRSAWSKAAFLLKFPEYCSIQN